MGGLGFGPAGGLIEVVQGYARSFVRGFVFSFLALDSSSLL